MARSAPQTSTRVALRTAVLWGVMIVIIAVGTVLGGRGGDEPLVVAHSIDELSVRLPGGFSVDTRTTDTGKVVFAERGAERGGEQVRVMVRDDVSSQDALRNFYVGQPLNVEPVAVAGRPGALATFVEMTAAPTLVVRTTYVIVANTADGRLLLIELSAPGRPDARHTRLLRSIADAAVLRSAEPTDRQDVQ